MISNKTKNVHITEINVVDGDGGPFRHGTYYIKLKRACRFVSLPHLESIFGKIDNYRGLFCIINNDEDGDIIGAASCGNIVKWMNNDD